MKITLKKASDYSFKEEREINTLDDLKELEYEFNPWGGLIISFNKDAYSNAPICYIYDDYIE